MSSALYHDQTILTIRFDTARFDLFWPRFFEDSTLETSKKIIRFVCSQDWINTEPLAFLETELPKLAAAKKDELAVAEKAYKDGYVDPKTVRRGAGRTVITERNALLKSQLSYAKRIHEKTVKLQEAFAEERRRWNV